MENASKDYAVIQMQRLGLQKLGIAALDSFQQQVFEAVQSQQNVWVTAPDGNHKTNLSLLAVLSRLLANRTQGRIQLLVVCTDEQHVRRTAGFISDLVENAKLEVVMLYNSSDAQLFNARKQVLAQGPAIVVGSVDRILVHVRLGNAMLSKLDHVLFTDTDRLIDKGCLADMLKLMTYMNGQQQMVVLAAADRAGIREFIAKCQATLPWKALSAMP
jgi:ATP-independent RNA helicase DbpA